MSEFFATVLASGLIPLYLQDRFTTNDAIASLTAKNMRQHTQQLAGLNMTGGALNMLGNLAEAAKKTAAGDMLNKVNQHTNNAKNFATAAKNTANGAIQAAANANALTTGTTADKAFASIKSLEDNLKSGKLPMAHPKLNATEVFQKNKKLILWSAFWVFIVHLVLSIVRSLRVCRKPKKRVVDGKLIEENVYDFGVINKIAYGLVLSFCVILALWLVKYLINLSHQGDGIPSRIMYAASALMCLVNPTIPDNLGPLEFVKTLFTSIPTCALNPTQAADNVMLGALMPILFMTFNMGLSLVLRIFGISFGDC